MKRFRPALLRGTIAACSLLPAAGAELFPPQRLARIQQGLRDIYNLEYARAAENFQGLIREAPDDPAGYAYLATTYWVQELSAKQELSIDRFAASDFFSELPKYSLRVDPAVEQRLRGLSAQAIEKARARLTRNPGDATAQFLLGLGYQNLASFEAALKRSWWSAVRHGSKTYRYHRELLRRDPNFHEARLTTGVYNYVAGSLGWNVKWIAFLMGYRGSRQRGKEELHIAAEKASLVGDDARVMLALIYTRERDYQKALDQLGELHKKYPQNYLLHLDMGGMTLLMNRPEGAAEIYQEILRKREAQEPKYAALERAALYNRLGVAFRHKGGHAAAAGWFGRSLAEAGVSARSATIGRLELGKTLDLMGRREQAREHYRAVAAAEDVAGSREEAQQLLRRAFRQ